MPEQDMVVYAVPGDPGIDSLFEHIAQHDGVSASEVARTFMLMGLHLWAQDHRHPRVAQRCAEILIGEAAHPENVEVIIFERH